MVKINEKYYIDADTRYYTLKEKAKTITKEGEEKEGFKDLGYYTTLDMLFRAILKFETRKYIKESNNSEIKHLLVKISEIEESLKEVFKGV